MRKTGKMMRIIKKKNKRRQSNVVVEKYLQVVKRCRGNYLAARVVKEIVEEDHDEAGDAGECQGMGPQLGHLTSLLL